MKSTRNGAAGLRKTLYSKSQYFIGLKACILPNQIKSCQEPDGVTPLASISVLAQKGSVFSDGKQCAIYWTKKMEKRFLEKRANQLSYTN